MSCCGKNTGNYYSRPNYFVGGAYGDNCCVANTCSKADTTCCVCVDDVSDFACGPVGVGGISSPCYNNNDLPCYCGGLRDIAKRLVNQRVIIHTEGCKMCVIIIGIGCCFLKTVNYTSNKVVYFNINRISDIEEVLPRCCN